jgi:HEPN domain-containing protein
MSDWLERQYDPPRGSSDSGRWQVHLALDLTEKDVIKKAAPQIIPAENFEVHTELADTGEFDAAFSVRVEAETADKAIAEATWILNKIRRATGLTAEPALVLGYISPSWSGPVSRLVGKEAIELLKQGRDELAVIKAQTACELLVAETLFSLLRLKHPDVDHASLIRRPATLNDKQSKALLQLLTGERVQDAQWWPKYVAHGRRRNAIVHDGLTIKHEDAQESIEVMNALHGWLLDVRQAAQDESDSDSDPRARVHG